MFVYLFRHIYIYVHVNTSRHILHMCIRAYIQTDIHTYIFSSHDCLRGFLGQSRWAVPHSVASSLPYERRGSLPHARSWDPRLIFPRNGQRGAPFRFPLSHHRSRACSKQTDSSPLFLSGLLVVCPAGAQGSSFLQPAAGSLGVVLSQLQSRRVQSSLIASLVANGVRSTSIGQ